MPQTENDSNQDFGWFTTNQFTQADVVDLLPVYHSFVNQMIQVARISGIR
jgi:predicted XRE-type DNA-binding protein